MSLKITLKNQKNDDFQGYQLRVCDSTLFQSFHQIFLKFSSFSTRACIKMMEIIERFKENIKGFKGFQVSVKKKRKGGEKLKDV